VEPGGPRGAQGGDRAGAKLAVLGDQRAVEVAGERLGVAREAVREPDQAPATDET
jgi:hypothetical protein